MMDAVISLSTLAAAGVSMAFSVSIEGILGVVISVFIFKAGIEILMEIEQDIIRRMKERFAAYEFIVILDSDVSD